MKIAVTGSSGFVGTNLVPFLGKKGWEVQPVNLRKGLTSLPEHAGAVIHLAGKAHDHKGTARPEEYFKVNTELTKLVFDHFLQSKATLFIHFSTVAAITDEHIEGVLAEEAVPRPATPYGQSKLQAEQYLLQQNLPKEKKVFIIRPAMIHGPGDKGNLTLLYNIVSKGIPYPLAAFQNQRSFLGIDNLNYTVGKLLEKANDMPSGIYNLVDDTPIASTDLVRLIAEVTGKKAKLWALPKFLARGIAKAGDILPLPINSKRLAKLTGNYVVSNDKIKKALGISAFPVSAKDGLIKTIKSFASE
jgi:nucleoside-diphosphate-sugar epimerase